MAVVRRIKSSRYLNPRPLVPETAGIKSNYAKTAIINATASSPEATAPMSRFEKHRMPESKNDVFPAFTYPITLLVFPTNDTVLENAGDKNKWLNGEKKHDDLRREPRRS